MSSSTYEPRHQHGCAVILISPLGAWTIVHSSDPALDNLLANGFQFRELAPVPEIAPAIGAVARRS